MLRPEGRESFKGQKASASFCPTVGELGPERVELTEVGFPDRYGVCSPQSLLFRDFIVGEML